MVPFVLFGAVLCLGFIVNLATHPVATLLATARVLFFIFAAGLTALYLTTSSHRSLRDDWPFLLLIAGFAAAWLLTFALPAAVRRRR